MPIANWHWRLAAFGAYSEEQVGIGKPEQSKYELTGFWSRRLSQYDRVVYNSDEESIHIFAIGGHYEKGV
jgi:toxin YoeB